MRVQQQEQGDCMNGITLSFLHSIRNASDTKGIISASKAENPFKPFNIREIKPNLRHLSNGYIEL
jgi:hypothetical protein